MESLSINDLIAILLNTSGTEAEKTRLEAASILAGRVQSEGEIDDLLMSLTTALSEINYEAIQLFLPGFFTSAKPELVDAIVEFVPDDDDSLWGWCYLLQHLGSKRAAGAVEQIVRSCDSECTVLGEVAKTLALLGGSNSIEFLLDMLATRSRDFRAEVALALKQMGEPAELACIKRLVIGDYPDCLYVSWLCGQEGPVGQARELNPGPSSQAAIRELVSLLDSTNPFVAKAAVEILASAGPRAAVAVERLASFLPEESEEDSEDDWDELEEVRDEAAIALLKIGLDYSSKHFARIWQYAMSAECEHYAVILGRNIVPFYQANSDLIHARFDREFSSRLSENRMRVRMMIAIFEHAQGERVIQELIRTLEHDETDFILIALSALSRRLGDVGLKERCSARLEQISQPGNREDVRTLALRVLND